MSEEQNNDLASEIQRRLEHTYSIAQCNIHGELQGRNENDHYVYEYIPEEKINDSEIIRLIFKERIDPRADTDILREKFCHVDGFCVRLPEMDMDGIPKEWTFLLKLVNFEPRPLGDLISFWHPDNSDRLGVHINAYYIEVTGFGPNDETISVDTSRVRGMISLEMAVKNLE